MDNDSRDNSQQERGSKTAKRKRRRRKARPLLVRAALIAGSMFTLSCGDDSGPGPTFDGNPKSPLYDTGLYDARDARPETLSDTGLYYDGNPKGPLYDSGLYDSQKSDAGVADGADDAKSTD